MKTIPKYKAFDKPRKFFKALLSFGMFHLTTKMKRKIHEQCLLPSSILSVTKNLQNKTQEQKKNINVPSHTKSNSRCQVHETLIVVKIVSTNLYLIVVSVFQFLKILMKQVKLYHEFYLTLNQTFLHRDEIGLFMSVEFL